MEKESVAQAMDICRMMQSDNVDFKSLNAGYYFAELNKIVQGENEILKKDQVPAVIIPIRRFFARGLDFLIYTIIWKTFIMLICGRDLTDVGFWGILANAFMIFVIMTLCESLLLSCFGTTVGKWILGIRVTNVDEGKLTFSEACGRCVRVIFSGYGLGIPIYELYRQLESYKTCKNGEPLSWEENSSIVLKDKNIWRNFVYAFLFIVVGVVQTILPCYAELPDHRGEITVSEYSESYNQMLEYGSHIGGGRVLDENGKWKISEQHPEYYELMEEDCPDITYYVENNKMKGMNIRGELPDIYLEEIGFLVKAFAYAVEPKCVLTSEAKSVYNYIVGSATDVEEKSFKIIDRMLPTQDVLTEGGVGNLIALPLQGKALKEGNSAFVDSNWNAYPNQWEILWSKPRLSKEFLEIKIREWTSSVEDMAVADNNENREKPWEKKEDFLL